MTYIMGAREQTIRLSTFFFLLFTPFSSYLTILTYIYEQDGLPGIGPATLAVNFTCFIVSTIVAPAVRWPLKHQFLLGAWITTLNYGSGIFVSFADSSLLKYLISCTGSGLAGCSAGFLWVSQGRYIHLACEKYGQLKRKGQMFGIFSSLYCFSNVSAGLITTFGLGFFNSTTYFLIISALGVIAALFCLFFVRDIPQSDLEMPFTNQEYPNGPQQTSQRPQQTGQWPQQAGLEALSPSQYSMWKVIKGTIAYIPVMWPVLLVLVIDGLALAFYSSEIPHLFPDGVDDDLLNKLAGLAVISMGIGSTISGFLCGIIADRRGDLFAGTLGLVSFMTSCSVVMCVLFWASIWLTLVAAFCWGFSLFYIESWMYIVCSRQYLGKSEAYSVNKQLHSLFYLLAQLAIFATDNQLPLKLIIAGLAGLALPALYLIRKLPSSVSP